MRMKKRCENTGGKAGKDSALSTRMAVRRRLRGENVVGSVVAWNETEDEIRSGASPPPPPLSRLSKGKGIPLSGVRRA